MPLRVSRRPLVLLFLTLGFILAGALAAPHSAQAQTTSATLLWTAPGDDGMTGRAARYDIRYSSNAIAGTDTTTWWNNATVVNTSGKVPATAGAADSMVVTGLTSGLRYFAIIRAGDEVPNWSGFSNIAVIDLTDRIAPTRIADLRAR